MGAVRPAPRPAVPSPLRAGARGGAGGAALDLAGLAPWLALFVTAAVVLMVRSHGAYHDDDLDHYFMARAALHQPRFLIDTWGRPAFNVLYALPAQLGWTATRAFTLLLAAATGWLTFRAAVRLGFRQAWLAAALALWQPLFYRLSFSSLAEPVAGLMIAALLWAMADDRPDLAAWMAGLLPLARLELVVLSPVVIAWLVRRRSLRALVGVVAPLALWAVVGGVVHGQPLWLLHAVGGAGRPLRSAGPVHYVRNLIAVIGPAAFLGLFIGLAALALGKERPRPLMAALVAALIFGELAALSWEALPFGNSIGFLRHLIVMAGPLGLVAGAGYEWVARASEGRARWSAVAIAAVTVGVTALWLSHVLEADFLIQKGHDWSRLAGLAPPALLVLVAVARPAVAVRPVWGHAVALSAALFCLVTVRPIDLNAEQKTVKAAVDYLRQEQLLGGPMQANHPWFYFLVGRDRWDRAATPYVTRQSLAAAAPGTIVVWDNHYGQRLYGDIPVEDLRRSPAWELIYEVESGDGQFRVVVFEKRPGVSR